MSFEFLPREHGIHIFEQTCNVLFIIWRNQFNKSKRRESWRHWTIRHSQRWHTENTPLGSRMKWRMESTSGLVPTKTLFSILLVIICTCGKTCGKHMSMWVGHVSSSLPGSPVTPFSHRRPRYFVLSTSDFGKFKCFNSSIYPKSVYFIHVC